MLGTAVSSNSEDASLAGREARLRFVQPFGNDICESWHEAASSASIHQEALEALRAMEIKGRVVLLSAPRAGHGKTHLLGRMAGLLRPDALVAGLPWQSRENLKWPNSVQGVLLDLASCQSGPSQLRQSCAGVLAQQLRTLVEEGRIPTANPAQAVQTLATEPMSLFEGQAPARVIGNWLCRHFETLCRPLAAATGLEERALVEIWLRRMVEAVQGPAGGEPALLMPLLQGLEPGDEKMAETWLRLISGWKPLVLVADHLDGLYRDAEAGLLLARLATALTALPRVQMVLSVNKDLWDTTLGRQLPSALEDRLSARRVMLQGLSLEEGRELVLQRLQDAPVNGAEVVEFIEFLHLEEYFSLRTDRPVAARELLRHAARRWHDWLHAAPAPSTALGIPSPAGIAMPRPPAQESLPLPFLDEAESDEDMLKLAKSLEQGGGKVVDLSQFGENEVSARDGVVPLPEGQSAEPFLLIQAEEPETAPSPPTTNQPSSQPAQASPNGIGRQQGYRLGEMLARLRESQNVNARVQTQEETVWEHEPSDATALAEWRCRFNELHQQVQNRRVLERMDLRTLQQVLRMAGRRFSRVRHDEVELPGLLGRSIPRWSLRGAEVVFALGEFEDRDFWRLISGYVAGRVAEIESGATRYGEPAPYFKWVVFTHQENRPAWERLLAEEVVPAALHDSVDAVLLTEEWQHRLTAMHEFGEALEAAEPSDGCPLQTLSSLLAIELETFWNRITRPLDGA